MQIKLTMTNRAIIIAALALAFALYTLLCWIRNGIGNGLSREIVSESISESMKHGAYIASYKPIAYSDSLHANLLKYNDPCLNYIVKQNLIFEHKISYEYVYIYFTKVWINTKDTCFVYQLWNDTAKCLSGDYYDYKLASSDNDTIESAFSNSGSYTKESFNDNLNDTIYINVYGDKAVFCGCLINLGSITYARVDPASVVMITPAK